MTYNPQYPILSPEDMLPKDQIVLVPESELSDLDKAEISQLRKGSAKYNLLIADTPENRERIAIKTAYFQMVAHKEGWNFDPQRYQVEFVDPNHFLLAEEGTQKRIYQPGVDKKESLSERFIGFTISGKQAIRMRDEEAGGLARRILNFFR